LVAAIATAMGAQGCAKEVLLSGANAIASLGANVCVALEPQDTCAAVDALAAVLKAYPADAEVQTSAVIALVLLFRPEFDVRGHMVATGCVEAMVATFDMFPECTDFQIEGCRLLCWLAGDPVLRARMVGAGVVRVLQDVLTAGTLESPTPVEHALELLQQAEEGLS
jgi:hypothetical protein